MQSSEQPRTAIAGPLVLGKGPPLTTDTCASFYGALEPLPETLELVILITIILNCLPGLKHRAGQLLRRQASGWMVFKTGITTLQDPANYGNERW